MCELAACIASDSAEFLKLLGMFVRGYEAQKLMSLLKEKKKSLFSDWHNLQGQEGWHLAIIGHTDSSGPWKVGVEISQPRVSHETDMQVSTQGNHSATFTYMPLPCWGSLLLGSSRSGLDTQSFKPRRNPW